MSGLTGSFKTAALRNEFSDQQWATLGWAAFRPVLMKYSSSVSHYVKLP